MLINIHTHNRTGIKNQLEIVAGEDTIGIHPWDLNKKADFSKARDYCLMIGETGLDRCERYKQTILEQGKILYLHFEAANKFNLPIVLHCVRAHSDLLKILKDLKYNGKILLHDFAGNAQQLNSYLDYDVYFSFRRKFEILKLAPLDRIFLETDDQTQFSIQDIYQQAGVAEMQFEINFLNLFSDAKDVRSADVVNYFSLALNSH